MFIQYHFVITRTWCGRSKFWRFLLSSSQSSKIHRVDLVIIVIVTILVLLNIHYLIFLELNASVEETLIDRTFNLIVYQNKSNWQKNDSIALNANNENNTFVIINYELFYICFPLQNTKYYFFLNNIWIIIDIAVYAL
jgi:hypothetical protein